MTKTCSPNRSRSLFFFVQAKARAQHAVLSLIRRLRLQGPSVRLFYPWATLYYSGILPSWVYKDIFVYNHYALPRALPRRARVVDLGANIGLSSLYFLTLLPQCHLTAIEPNPVAFECLRKTLASVRTHTAGRNAHLVNGAVTDKECELLLYVPTGCPTALNASITNRHIEAETRSPIKVRGLDWRKLCDTPVHFMKLDIEGSEYAILGSEDFTSKVVGSFVAEFHDIDKRRDEFVTLFQRLIDHGGFCAESVDGQPRRVTDFDALESSTVIRFRAKKIWW
jgi:FkbM family methyltransferase